jgi:small-conductance mechanosensitive channel
VRLLPRLPSRPGGLGTALLCILLWLFAAATADSPVLGVGSIRTAIIAAAVVFTSLAIVLGGSWLILTFSTTRRSGVAPTGLHRVLVHAVVTLVVAYLVLNYFGFDVRALLTTSAIATAALGFAMQPTLGSMISGIALSSDRTLRVGDGILRGGEAMRVEAMNWRNVVASKADGTMLVLPNAKLSDAELEILPHDRSVRAEIIVKLPAAEPPQHVAVLAQELIGDSPLIDRTRPVSASPMEWEADGTFTRYRIRYWVRRYRDLGQAEADGFRRLWYGFQRHHIGLADPPTAVRGCMPAELAALLKTSLPELQDDAAQRLAEAGECLIYAPGERLVMPDRTEGWRFVLLRGEAEPRGEVPQLASSAGTSGIDLQRDGRVVAVHRIAGELAKRIGPYAEYAVTRAARTSTDLDELCREVALEIPEGPARTGFLDDMQPDSTATFGPGFRFSARRDAVGTLVCDQWLQAKDEVLVLAVPPSLADVPGFGACTGSP